MFGGNRLAAAGGGAAVGAAVGEIAGVPGAAVGMIGGPLLQELFAKTPLNKVLKAQEDFYRFGDNGFKWQQYWRDYQHNLGDMDLLQPGQYKNVPTNKGATRIERGEGQHWLLDGQKVEHVAIKEALMDSAIESAQNRFFDYRDTPLLVDMLKTIPLFSLVSPFITWQWKALDIPFVKKGLISRTFELPGAGLTNSPIIAAKQFAKSMGLSQRRSFMINGMRHQQSENRSEFRRFLAFSPAEPRAILLRQTTSPLWIEADDIDQYNWQAPGQTLIRMADGWLNSAPSSQDLEEYVSWTRSLDDLRDLGLLPNPWIKLTDDYVKQQIHMARNRFTMGGALKLIGLGGSVWGEVFGMFQAEEEKGQMINQPKMYTAISSAILGGGLSKMLKITAGLTSQVDSDPYLMSGFTTRDSQAKNIRESVIRYSVRALLGMGYRPQFVGDSTSLGDDKDLKPKEYFKRGIRRQGNVLKSTMFGRLNSRIERLKRKQVDIRSDFLAGRIEDLEIIVKVGKDLIDDEIKNWIEQVRSTFEDYDEVVGE